MTVVRKVVTLAEIEACESMADVKGLLAVRSVQLLSEAGYIVPRDWPEVARDHCLDTGNITLAVQGYEGEAA